MQGLLDADGRKIQPAECRPSLCKPAAREGKEVVGTGRGTRNQSARPLRIPVCAGGVVFRVLLRERCVCVCHQGGVGRTAEECACSKRTLHAKRDCATRHEAILRETPLGSAPKDGDTRKIGARVPLPAKRELDGPAL